MILTYGSLKVDFKISIGLLNSTERLDEESKSKQKPRQQKQVRGGQNGRKIHKMILPEAAGNINRNSRGRYGIAVVKSQLS